MPSIIAARRRGRRDEAMHLCVDAALHFVRRVDQHRMHDRRAAVMRDLVRRGSHRRSPSASTLRRHTFVPAFAAIVHAKHQPLQWNIGSVHRYTACRGMPQSMMLDSALR